ncbi:hypothetical protein KVR01_012933 [Diaporthe batatas]|uniref:uncharacterized protein n=1 Tax=Diaporthe batatas TaxID=748121 RepID=UPI001D0503B6|nr:uncharacterized protein KVR01_012933 [Diaporthe batatas]KAG8157225.1 hypothetical protein KVR01_012933 [Diaporthe batatas]
MSSQGSPRPVRITTFPLRDQPGRIAAYAAAAALITLVSRRALVEPGSVLYETLLRTPEAAATAARVQNYAFVFIFGAHAVEAPLFAATKLRKHGVPFLSLLWWKWVAACCLGGVAAWKHFALTVAAAEGKRA